MPVTASTWCSSMHASVLSAPCTMPHRHRRRAVSRPAGVARRGPSRYSRTPAADSAACAWRGAAAAARRVCMPCISHSQPTGRSTTSHTPGRPRLGCRRDRPDATSCSMRRRGRRGGRPKKEAHVTGKRREAGIQLHAHFPCDLEAVTYTRCCPVFTPHAACNMKRTSSLWDVSVQDRPCKRAQVSTAMNIQMRCHAASELLTCT